MGIDQSQSDMMKLESSLSDSENETSESSMSTISMLCVLETEFHFISSFRRYKFSLFKLVIVVSCSDCLSFLSSWSFTDINLAFLSTSMLIWQLFVRLWMIVLHVGHLELLLLHVAIHMEQNI